MRTSQQLFLLAALLLGLSACQPPSTVETASNLTPAPSPKLSLEQKRASTARAILATIFEHAEPSEDWNSRILQTELKPLFDELYLLRQRGLEPAKPSYEAAFYTVSDLELLDRLEKSIQANPQMGLDIENLLRTFNLMDCETLDAAARSWLVVQNP